MVLMHLALCFTQPMLDLDCLAPLGRVKSLLKEEHKIEVSFPDDLMGQVVYLKCCLM